MIHRPIVVWIAATASLLALSGCYTVLRAPSFGANTTASSSSPYTWEDDSSAASSQVQDSAGASTRYPYGYGPTRSAGATGATGTAGAPLFGYDTLYGLYGFGSPFAYGPYGGLYSGGYGYGSAAGPYGYGYDPYYSGVGGTSIPPGYELITTDALDALRSGQRLDTGGGNGSLSEAERATQMRRQQLETRRAWTQRTQPHRKSTTAVRTARPAASSSRVTTRSGSSSSSSKGSGSSAAKRRGKRR